MKFLRVSVLLVVVGVALSWGVRPAKADPHALFFTAIGQQQLFFNALAALDQADYVEQPGGDTCSILDTNGEPCDPVFTRKEVAERLDAIRENPSDVERNPSLTATLSGLAGTITRGVTVEGADLWEAYKLRQAAVEWKQRAALKEWSARLCNAATGKCGGPLTESDVYVQNPQAASRAGGTSAVAALFSNTDLYADYAQQQQVLNQSGAGGTVVPYSASVAALWGEAGSDEVKQRLLLSAVYSAAQAMGPGSAPDVFSGVEVDGDDNIVLSRQDTPENTTLLARLSQPFVGKTARAAHSPTHPSQIAVLSNIASFPARIFSLALAGTSQIREFNNATTGPNGERAGYDLHIAGGRDPITGDVITQGTTVSINTPSYLRPAAAVAFGNAVTAGNKPVSVPPGASNEDGVTVAPPPGLEFFDESSPRCYVPGQEFSVKFSILNNSKQTPQGIIRLATVGTVDGVRRRVNNSAESPPLDADNGFYLDWKDGVQSGNYTTFTVQDAISADYSGPLAYVVKFYHTGTLVDGIRTHTWRFDRPDVCPDGQTQPSVSLVQAKQAQQTQEDPNAYLDDFSAEVEDEINDVFVPPAPAQ